MASNKEHGQKLMKVLEITESEALEVIKSDKEIDQNKKLFELSPEQEKESKKARQAQAPTVYKFKEKVKKIDTDKRKIISNLCTNLKDMGCDEVVAENEERIISFEFMDTKYRLTLMKPRVPKKE